MLTNPSWKNQNLDTGDREEEEEEEVENEEGRVLTLTISVKAMVKDDQHLSYEVHERLRRESLEKIILA